MTTRQLQFALAASLFVNLFAIGTIAGGLVILARPNIAAPRAVGRPIRSAAQDLPAAEQSRFQEIMRQTVASNRDLARTARISRRDAAALFMQPQFDRDAAAALLDRARQADFTLRSRLEATALDFAATLPADERAALAIGLERHGPLRGARP